METQIEQLKKQIRNMRIYMYVLTAIVPLFLFLAFTPGNTPGVLRVKGIIIVDSLGKERILIGAPVPYSANRVRTDSARVEKVWGKRYPPEAKYMEYYKGYNHSTTGILILDENGYDRVALGAPVPDPNVGKRLGQGAGIIINDEEGWERTGYGLLNVGGKNRVILGLDNDRGKEGAALVVLEDGTAGLMVMDEKKMTFFGKVDTANWVSNKKMNGILIKDGDKVKYDFNLLAK